MVDLGCWIGIDGEHLARRYTVVGVDIQPHLIDYARKHRSELDFRVGNITSIRLGRAFDAVLCVGNTLLLNGTVHSPPYVVSAIAAGRDRFEADPLVRRLRSDAESFGLRISVERQDALLIPAFTGATTLRFARPVETKPD